MEHGLLGLPDDVLLQVLRHTTPRSVFNLRASSRRCKAAADASLRGAISRRLLEDAHGPCGSPLHARALPRCAEELLVGWVLRILREASQVLFRGQASGPAGDPSRCRIGHGLVPSLEEATSAQPLMVARCAQSLLAGLLPLGKGYLVRIGASRAGTAVGWVLCVESADSRICLSLPRAGEVEASIERQEALNWAWVATRRVRASMTTRLPLLRPPDLDGLLWALVWISSQQGRKVCHVRSLRTSRDQMKMYIFMPLTYITLPAPGWLLPESFMQDLLRFVLWGMVVIGGYEVQETGPIEVLGPHHSTMREAFVWDAGARIRAVVNSREDPTTLLVLWVYVTRSDNDRWIRVAA